MADRVWNWWGFLVSPEAPGVLAHTIWPDGCVSVLVVQLPGMAPFVSVAGPRAQALQLSVRAGASYWGMRFHPDAGGEMLGTPAPLLRDVARSLMGNEFARFGSLAAALPVTTDPEQAFAALTGWAARALPSWEGARDSGVRRAVDAIIASRGERSIAEVAREALLAPRTLQRRFRHLVGLAPKEFARVRRLRSAMGERMRRDSEGWATVAMVSGYADQAHLAREFAELAGHAPSEVDRRLRAIEHRNVTP